MNAQCSLPTNEARVCDVKAGSLSDRCLWFMTQRPQALGGGWDVLSVGSPTRKLVSTARGLRALPIALTSRHGLPYIRCVSHRNIPRSVANGLDETFWDVLRFSRYEREHRPVFSLPRIFTALPSEDTWSSSMELGPYEVHKQEAKGKLSLEEGIRLYQDAVTKYGPDARISRNVLSVWSSGDKKTFHVSSAYRNSA